MQSDLWLFTRSRPESPQFGAAAELQGLGETRRAGEGGEGPADARRDDWEQPRGFGEASASERECRRRILCRYGRFNSKFSRPLQPLSMLMGLLWCNLSSTSNQKSLQSPPCPRKLMFLTCPLSVGLFQLFILSSIDFRAFHLLARRCFPFSLSFTMKSHHSPVLTRTLHFNSIC